MLPITVSAFLDTFSRWASSQPDVQAVALVGSYARGETSEGSDVDLVILTSNVDKYLRDRSWISVFGKFTGCLEEDYGIVTSVRTFYESGLEVQYSFTTPDWAETPIDAGTLRVVREGMKAVYDPQGIIDRMRREIGSSGK